MTDENAPAPIGVAGSYIQLTHEQNVRLDRIRQTFAQSFDRDDLDSNIPINAAIRYLNTDENSRLGTLEATGEDLADARGVETAARAAAQAVALLAAEDGFSEVALARALGVDRMTIRKWVGKSR
jgi:hypothetical protein